MPSGPGDDWSEAGMSPLRRRLLAQVFKLFDAMMVAVIYLGVTTASTWMHHNVSYTQALALTVRVDALLVLAVLLLAWHWAFAAFGLYDSQRLASRRREIIEVVLAALIAALVSLVPATLLHVSRMGWRQAATLWAIATSTAIAIRLVLRQVLSAIRLRGRNRRYVVIVGTGLRAMRFAQQIEAEPELGYDLVGFVDDEWANMDEFRHSGYRLLGTLAEFPHLLKDTVIDEIVLALPMNSQYQRASQVVALAEEQGIIVRMLADLFDAKRATSTARWAHESVVTLFPGSADPPGMAGKRVLDLLLSAALLLIAAPLMLATALWIKLDSPGPVLFCQLRRGLNKRPFTMLKFRTMRADADALLASVEHLNLAQGPGFKIQNDPRVTRPGRLLRKYSIDEIPQLINVLKGDMSLVGPRPMFFWDFERLEPWIKRRCSVRPGLTGLWQVSGRNNLPFDKRIELDLEYIDNWSLLMDVDILARTIPAVVLGRGAV